MSHASARKGVETPASVKDALDFPAGKLASLFTAALEVEKSTLAKLAKLDENAGWNASVEFEARVRAWTEKAENAFAQRLTSILAARDAEDVYKKAAEERLLALEETDAIRAQQEAHLIATLQLLEEQKAITAALEERLSRSHDFNVELRAIAEERGRLIDALDAALRLIS